MAQNEDDMQNALEPLLVDQQSDFEGILEAMDGLEVTVRLLDPPLHEFLPSPNDASAVAELAQTLECSVEAVKARIEELAEVNPMLGFRGCRLGIIHPEITRMQVRALLQAAVKLSLAGKDPRPAIMVPLIGSAAELRNQTEVIREMAKEVFMKHSAHAAEAALSVPPTAPYLSSLVIPFPVGTMIEVPRAALLSAQIAPYAQFFSFGTNDLTQMTYGFSRDDVAKFLPQYKKMNLVTSDPFETVDMEGVGWLMRKAAEDGRAANPTLQIGICGEHGGDPRSVHFFHELGLDYVSCSPLRVPVARLAAAHAAIAERQKQP